MLLQSNINQYSIIIFYLLACIVVAASQPAVLVIAAFTDKDLVKHGVLYPLSHCPGLLFCGATHVFAHY